MRVYIAGAMSSPDPVKFLENLRKGIRVSAEALVAGYSVFSPFIDFQMFLALQGDEHVSGDMIKLSSIEWMTVAEAVLLVPGWEHSKGTLKELEVAMALGIPIYRSLEQLEKEVKQGGESEEAAPQTMSRQDPA